MKKSFVLVWLLVLVLMAYSNPRPPAEVTRISAYPPEIEIECSFGEDTLDISGCIIVTSQSYATVNPGTIYHSGNFNGFILLDSVNTSGFIINPEGDSVYSNIAIDDYEVFLESIKLGNLGRSSPPLKGHPTTLNHYLIYFPGGDPVPWNHYSFNFSNPDFGWTEIVINEINTHGAWQNNSDFIELFNKSNDPLSLAGWKIVCDTVFDMPDDAFIPAFGYYVVDEEVFPPTFDMDCSADNIYLLNANDRIYINGPRLVDQVGWSSDHGENVSFMRYPDGDADSSLYMTAFLGYNDASSGTFENGFPTRGAANRHDCPGFAVIGAAADSIDDGSARIHWTDPIWDEQFDHSVLVKSLEGYPETPSEGEVIHEGTDQQFTDNYIPPSGPAYYTVFAYDLGGEYSTPTGESRTYIWFGSAGVDDPVLPEKISSLNCYPNPFNAQTTISFSLEKQAVVTISIYDITGRLVEVLTSRTYDAGNHALIWDAGNRPSGIYFARMNAGETANTNRMVLLK